MSFSEPLVNEEGRYAAVFQTGGTSMIEIVLTTEEGVIPGEETDALFQALVDIVSASPLFEFSSARKTQKVSSTTEVVPTAPEG